MNMKKTLAGLMAGVVAISAMATVAVSAKEQKADSKTWSTVVAQSKEQTVDVVLELGDGTNTPAGVVATLADGNGAAGVKFGDIKKVTVLKGSMTPPETTDLTDAASAIVTKTDNTITVNTTGLLAAKDVVFVTVETKLKVVDTAPLHEKNNPAEAVTALKITGTNVKSSHKKVEIAFEDKGDIVNPRREANPTGKEWYHLDTADIYDTTGLILIDAGLLTHIGTDKEPVQEIADYIKDAKGATIAFNFKSGDMDATAAGGFTSSDNRYDWGAMESAISMRINKSNELSVAMSAFDSKTFTAKYELKDVLAKFQAGSVTGLLNQIELKVNNDKLPKKDGKPIELELVSIEVIVPEGEVDDNMVEDFAAGESATVVEATLPATTNAPAATDAPAATTAATDGAANPETGNSAVALLAIPAALAAAAIVAKKRG